jgi:hypothetical protein
MSRSVLWSVIVFTVFAFATLIIFFWIREGSLSEAGASVESLLGKAGAEVSEGAGNVADATGNAIDKATDGDDRT